MKPWTQEEILAALVEIFELPATASPATTVHVDSLASLSIQATAAERWGLLLNPIELESMGSLAEVLNYIGSQGLSTAAVQ